MTARWVLGGQDPGFPAKEGAKEEIKNVSRGGGDQDFVKKVCLKVVEVEARPTPRP